ncbi:MAG: fructosamine kinase family protein [Halobacteriales archaeon]|nr:fructosamine kinase family protein [Halobacteriales archaeon]
MEADAIVERVAAEFDASVDTIESLDGGLVGDVYRLDLTSGQQVVAKTGETPLSIEGRMLEYLRERTALPVPTVHAVDDTLLVMAYVSGCVGRETITPAVERDIADGLAALHTETAPRAGFHIDTLAGPIEQPNPWMDSWSEFFRIYRLEHVAEIARTAGDLPDSLYERILGLASDLDTILADPPAYALLHGDVWFQNLIVDADAETVAAYIDPAIYYGHPEVELAYVDWTETVGEAFYERYRDHRPIEAGFFDQRYPVYALQKQLEQHWYFDRSTTEQRVDQYLDTLGY